MSVKGNTAALGVGLLAGWYVYQRKTAKMLADLKQGVCANAPPGALQSLGDAIRGAWGHLGVDAVLGTLGLADLLARLETLGLWQPDSAADFYAWWNNLTPAQKAQVKATEDGTIYCAAAETGAQLATGSDALLEGFAAGAAAYVVAGLVLED